MRIQKTPFESFQSPVELCQYQKCQPFIQDSIRNGASSLSTVQRATLAIIDFVKQIFLTLYGWFRSCFCSGKKSKPFYKIETDGNIHYQLDGTENEVKLGLRVVDLKEISFPDKQRLPALKKMLSYIMKHEMIDRISVTNLYQAWLLWKANLKTDYSLRFDPKSPSPFNKFVQDHLMKAKNLKDKGQLEEKPKQALEKIEKKLLQAVMESGLEVGGFYDTEGKYNIKTITDHLLALEKQLKITFELNKHIEKLAQDSTERKVMCDIRDAAKSSRGGGKLLPFYEISIHDFFCLVQDSGKDVGREGALFIIPTALFSRS